MSQDHWWDSKSALKERLDLSAHLDSRIRRSQFHANDDWSASTKIIIANKRPKSRRHWMLVSTVFDFTYLLEQSVVSIRPFSFCIAHLRCYLLFEQERSFHRSCLLELTQNGRRSAHASSTRMQKDHPRRTSRMVKRIPDAPRANSAEV